MLLFSITAVVFTALSVVCAIQCVVNFDHGLRSVISDGGKTERDSYNFRNVSSPTSSESSRFGVD